MPTLLKNASRQSSRWSRAKTLFLLLLLTSLAGCLVNGGNGKTYMRETDSIHLYQSGDFIEYNVSGTVASGISAFHSVTGTMRIDWSTPSQPLLDPINSDVLTGLLKEVITLDVDGTVTHTVRYISQDANGNIFLHAFDKNGTEYYWVNDTGPTPPSGTAPLNSVQLWQSPIPAVGTSVSSQFYVYDLCTSSNPCSDYLGTQSETDKVENNDLNVQTDPGVFNTFQVSVSGYSQPGSGVSVFLPVNTLDPRSSCSSHGANFSGQMYVYPQVGVVAMNINCFDSTSGYPSFIYTFSFKRAGGSITLPAPS